MQKICEKLLVILFSKTITKIGIRLVENNCKLDFNQEYINKF